MITSSITSMGHESHYHDDSPSSDAPRSSYPLNSVLHLDLICRTLLVRPILNNNFCSKHRTSLPQHATIVNACSFFIQCGYALNTFILTEFLDALSSFVTPFSPSHSKFSISRRSKIVNPGLAAPPSRPFTPNAHVLRAYVRVFNDSLWNLYSPPSYSAPSYSSPALGQVDYYYSRPPSQPTLPTYHVDPATFRRTLRAAFQSSRSTQALTGSPIPLPVN
ncbi:hypothetical protein GALMADRAFT_148512 [Galerina marginata CBS 339.88]|uniref:Uncharacterized protein n=1 Tax=Galerina marginata (strain CBS 339.88) TaxID=685588 RepID=A0A067S486_GALM3|nr:hypothetical protein GALMADRAFT_148512 [Galerina marginata CBS 339.88]